jgi:hypothetical protein
MSIRSILLASLCVLTACAAQLSPGGGNGGGGGNSGGGNSGGGDTGGSNGGGGNTGSGGAGGGMTATQYLTQMEQKFCDEAFTCQASFPATATETFADDFGASAAECYADDAAYDMPDVVESEITAGKIHFDASAAASCVAGITFSSCTTFWQDGGTYPASCDTALVGTVADGGACVVDYDCTNLASVCDQTAHTCGPAPAGA